ncbi:MAG: box helicase domain protein, partial [Solirubrobacterales bacterium]|nr:box helicase domain protein [Solirubrobacterales bacterium]
MTKSFSDLGVSEVVSKALLADGIESPFAIQQLVIGDVLAGHDTLVKSPTGSGKTLAFGVPLVDRVEANVAIGKRPCALVLAPTRELASQIVDDLRPLAHARALGITAVYGGVGLEKQARAAAKSHIIVATPGRLEDLLQRRAFSLSNVKMLVLDEADRMLDMGFKPAVDRIVALCPRSRQTLFFSATLDGEAGRIANQFTTNPRTHEQVATVSHIAKVEHRFLTVAHEHKLKTLKEELMAAEDLCLVFVRTKRGADRLVQRLAKEHVDAVAMHGDKSQRQREKALARFEAGDVRVLVATDVAARGIDVDGVGHVINFDPPEDSDAYVHRIGRTGRAGRTGVGTTFARPDEIRDVAAIAEDLKLEHPFDVRNKAHRGTVGHQPNKRPTNAGGGSGPAFRGGGSSGG